MIKVFLTVAIVVFFMNGCTADMAESFGGPLAGAAIQNNNEHYSNK
jgi:outer membrane lipoprotein-sorting protein